MDPETIHFLPCEGGEEGNVPHWWFLNAKDHENFEGAEVYQISNGGLPSPFPQSISLDQPFGSLLKCSFLQLSKYVLPCIY